MRWVDRIASPGAAGCLPRSLRAVAAAQTLLPARVPPHGQLGNYAGRIATHALMGAAHGAAGAMALQAAQCLPLQRAIYLAALFLLLLGVSIALGTSGVAWLRRARAATFAAALPAVRPLLRRPGITGASYRAAERLFNRFALAVART